MLNQQKDWKTFNFKNRKTGVVKGGQIFMDHYLILLFHEVSSSFENVFSFGSPPTTPTTTLLAFDLRSNNSQKVKLDESLFPSMGSSTFTKYKDNQIIGFRDRAEGMVQITIESFQPLSVKCEDIKIEGDHPKLFSHTAQIYNDTLFVFGGRNPTNLFRKNESSDLDRVLWTLDLKNSEALSWKICESSGERPKSLMNRPQSFIIQDNLYIYDNEGMDGNAVSVLDLNSLVWTQLEQKEVNLRKNFGCTVFTDHLLVLKQIGGGFMSKNANAWSNFDVGNSEVKEGSTLVVYKNSLVTSGFKELSKESVISILNLDDTGFSLPESLEQKRIKSLFMNEEESDIKFKIQDQIIHAHKNVLIQKSKYFANLFNSGMAESRQDVIEIPDEDVLLFQEFLRFLYRDEVKKVEDLAIKLFIFVDKYVQKDLREKCVDILGESINSGNVYKIFDFACEENVNHLRDCCRNFFKEKRIDVYNITELMEFLNKEKNSEFAQEDLELRNTVCSFIVKNYLKLYYFHTTSTPYEDFLIESITLNNVLDFGRFTCQYLNDEHDNRKEKERFHHLTVNLKAALMKFIQTNYQILYDRKIVSELPIFFLADLLLQVYGTKGSNQQNGLQEEQQASQ